MPWTLFFSKHLNWQVLSITRLQLFSTRVLYTHIGGLKAACMGSALSKFRQSVTDRATYSRDSFGNGMTRGTTWEGVEVAKMKNAP